MSPVEDQIAEKKNAPQVEGKTTTNSLQENETLVVT